MASPIPEEDTDFRKLNSEGLANLLEAARVEGVRTVVHLSTLDVHGFKAGKVDERTPPNPADQYQKSKADAKRVLTEFAKANDAPRLVVIRAARTVGSRDWTLAVPLLRMILNRKVILPQSSETSFVHPKDVAQAMYKAATNRALSGEVYLVKSFDADAQSLARQLAASVVGSADFRQSGFRSKPALPRYTVWQLEASLRIEAQASWYTMGYSPGFDLARTCDEIAQWYRKEPWIAEPA
jgi:nucleoside-diphosphate-sugar epimerase